MALARWLGALRSRARYRITVQLPEVLSAPDFQKVLERERMRADRNSSQLSLLLLDVAGPEWDGVSLHEPLLAFTRRLRLSDEVGWLDRRTVAVLLPDTGAPGAHKLADELEAYLAGWHVRGQWKVFTYPGTWDPADGNGLAAGGNGHHRPVGVPAAAAGADSPVPERGPEAGQPERQERNGTPQAVPAEAGAPRASSLRAPESFHSLFLRPSPLLKRSVDVVVAGLALLVLSPVMLLAALAVKLTSPGPVIFRQTRVGLGGRHFDFFKFRTMRVDAEERKKDLLHRNEVSGPVFKIKNDPRMTPVGKLLRKTSIDELPQLWNVLRGDMSLVGPRPPVPEEVRVYDPWQRRRLEVPGGLTCIWQVSGRSEIPFEEWVRMDIRYGRRRSLWYDFLLLARTIPAVLTGRGAR